MAFLGPKNAEHSLGFPSGFVYRTEHMQENVKNKANRGDAVVYAAT